MANKLKSLFEYAGSLGDICIVNTDGYVRDAGVEYKLMITKELQPDVIVCLIENPALLEAHVDGPWKVLRSRVSSQASKSKFERKSRRLDQFLRHVGGGSSTAALRHIKFAYADVLFSPTVLNRPKINQQDQENVKRMFVGLGSGSRVTGFGIVTGVTASIIRIQTDVDYFDKVYLSNKRLDKIRPIEVTL